MNFLDEVGRAPLKTQHKKERDKKICDRIKAVFRIEELLLVKEEILRRLRAGAVRRPRKPHSSANPPLKERDCARAYRSI